MKIYTKTGDDGHTGLFAGPRVWKDDARIDAYGTVDELNAVLGWARNEVGVGPLDDLLVRIQHQLFALGAELATPEPEKHGTNMIGELQIAELEGAIDSWDAPLPPLKQFVLPGGSPGQLPSQAGSIRTSKRLPVRPPTVTSTTSDTTRISLPAAAAAISAAVPRLFSRAWQTKYGLSIDPMKIESPVSPERANSAWLADVSGNSPK